MADPIPYDNSSDALLRPAKGAVFFQSWTPKDTANHDLLCAEMSRLAYASESEIGKALSRIGFSSVQFIGGESQEAQQAFLGTHGFVARAPGGLAVLAFRGTESGKLDDLIADIQVVQTEWPGAPECRVHSGFSRCWSTVKARVSGLLAEHDGELLMTGHSLGAALATLAAIELRPAKLITFGSPRVGNAAFCDLLQGIPVRRFVNACDLIARLPPERFDRDHLAQVFTEVARLEGDPSVSASLKRGAIRAAAKAIEAVFRGLGLDPSFAHATGGRYGDAGGTIREGIGDADKVQDQRAARRAYKVPAEGAPREPSGASFEELRSIGLATSAEAALQVLRRFFAQLLGPIGSTVPLRDLADHAPINYVSLFTGRR